MRLGCRGYEVDYKASCIREGTYSLSELRALGRRGRAVSEVRYLR